MRHKSNLIPHLEPTQTALVITNSFISNSVIDSVNFKAESSPIENGVIREGDDDDKAKAAAEERSNSEGSGDESDGEGSSSSNSSSSDDTPPNQPVEIDRSAKVSKAESRPKDIDEEEVEEDGDDDDGVDDGESSDSASSDDQPPGQSSAPVPTPQPNGKARNDAAKRASSSPENDSKRQRLDEALICEICADEYEYPAVVCANIKCQKVCCMKHYDDWSAQKNGKTEKMKCMYCRVLWDEFIPHKMTNQIVGARLIQCRNDCGIEVRADGMDVHLDKYCTQRKVRCSQQKFGCKWMGSEEECKKHSRVCDFEQRAKAMEQFASQVNGLKENMLAMEKQKALLVTEIKQIEERFRQSVEDSMNLFVAKRAMALENPKPSIYVKLREEDSFKMILSYSHGGHTYTDAKMMNCNDNTPIITINVEVSDVEPHYYQLWGTFEKQQFFPLVVSGIVCDQTKDLAYPVAAVNQFAFRFSKNGEQFLFFDEEACHKVPSGQANQLEDLGLGKPAGSDNPFENLDVAQDSVQVINIQRSLSLINFSISLFLMRRG